MKTLVAAVAALAIVGQPAFAQPITLVVPTEAGAAVDIVARVAVAAKAPDVVVKNEPAAAGLIAAANFAQSTDSNVVLVGTSAITAGQEALRTMVPAFANAPKYNPLSFTPLCHVVSFTFVLVTGVEGVRTVDDLVALGRKSDISWGSGGAPQQIMGMQLLDSLKLNAVHVPYARRDPGVAQALIQKEIAFAVLPTVLAADKLHGLAVMGNHPSMLMPGVPLVAKVIQGFQTLDLWAGLFGIPGLSSEQAAQLRHKLCSGLEDEPLKVRLGKRDLAIQSSTPKELTEKLGLQQKLWAEGVKLIKK